MKCIGVFSTFDNKNDMNLNWCKSGKILETEFSNSTCAVEYDLCIQYLQTWHIKHIFNLIYRFLIFGNTNMQRYHILFSKKFMISLFCYLYLYGWKRKEIMHKTEQNRKQWLFSVEAQAISSQRVFVWRILYRKCHHNFIISQNRKTTFSDDSIFTLLLRRKNLWWFL